MRHTREFSFFASPKPLVYCVGSLSLARAVLRWGEGPAVMDEAGAPTSRHAAVAKALRLRLEALSSPEAPPPPVSGSGDDDAFPKAACAVVGATGSWLPWEWDDVDP